MKSKEEAIVFLQRLWKRKFKSLTLHNIIEYLFSIGSTIEHIKSLRFELFTVFINEKSIISANKACFQRIYKLCILRHGNIVPENININIKIFLSAFMVAYHKTRVFENMDTLEISLHNASEPLIITFQNICMIIKTSNNHSFQDVPKELSKYFLMTLIEYFKCFKEWEVPDKIKLIRRIKNALITLYRTKNISHNEFENSNLKNELDAQIIRLRDKLKQIAGIESLNQFDIEQNSGINTVYDNSFLDTTQSTIFSVTNNDTNEYLAHEILLNPDFKFYENNNDLINPIFRCKQSFEPSFWDNLENDIKLSCYTQVLQVLTEIRDRINITSRNTKVNNMLKKINIYFFIEQAEANLSTWDNHIQLISSIFEIVQHIQAPHRNEEIKEKWDVINQQMQDVSIVDDQSRVLRKALEFLLKSVNISNIDTANARIQLIAPVIKEHGIEYEQSKFQNKLDCGILTLERTKIWINLILRQEVSTLKTVDLENLYIHSVAIMSLITNKTPIKLEICPETLLLDLHSLCIIQKEFQYIVTSITIILKIKNYLVDNLTILTNITELFTSETMLEINLEKIIIEIDQAISQISLTQNDRESLLNILKQFTSSDTVYDNVYNMIKIVWDKCIINNINLNDIDIIDIVKPFIPRIEKTVKKLKLLTDLNKKVHIVTYKKLIEEESLKLIE